jgi:hypothetical protein
VVPRDDAVEHEGRRRRKRRKQAEGQLASGLTFSAVFGALLLFHGGWFWIFPFAFAGVLQAVQAFLSLRRLGDRPRAPAPALPDPQKEVLRIARRHDGRVTAAMVALDSPLSMADSERTLDELVRSGHAGMAVADDGRVEYEFREFLPPPDADR